MIAARLRRPRLGAAISTTRVVVSTPVGAPGAPGPWTRDLSSAGGSRAVIREIELGLADALRDACGTRALSSSRLSVAVVPPLAECRVVDLPGLRDDEIARVLQRDAARYFPTALAPLATAAVRLGRAAGGRVLATAMPVELLEAVHRAAAAAQCEVESIQPALAAWLAALPAVWQLEPDGGSVMVASLTDHVEVVRVERGRPIGIRRLRTASATPQRIVETIRATRRETGDAGAGQGAARDSGGEPVVLAPVSRETASLAVALSALGERLVSPVRRPELAQSAELLAAAFVHEGGGPSLMPERERIVRRRRTAHRARVMMIVAAVALAGTAVLELWDLRRERRYVAGYRAAIASSLAPMLERRDSLSSALDRLHELQAAEQGAPRWSAALVALAARLPRGAFVLSLRAEGDSLIADLAADHASPVLEALGRAPELGTVRAQGSVRQELRPGARLLERFTLVIRPVMRESSPGPSASIPVHATSEGGSP